MFVHNIDPVAISLGSIKVHWYGLMYLISFLAIWAFLQKRLLCYPHVAIDKNKLTDFISLYIVVGVIVGGRVGYVLLYGTEQFTANPLFLFKIWQGGMSFHGGFVGVAFATYLFARRHGIHPMDMLDFGLVATPIGLFFGRIGNFIGGELWGSPTSLPWGVVFPRAGNIARHPSQLYEALLEGLVLWLVLWWLASTPRPRMFISSVFCIGYAVARICVEFVREPDAHIGYLAFNFVTMGMVVSTPILVLGLWCVRVSLRNNIIPQPLHDTVVQTSVAIQTHTKHSRKKQAKKTNRRNAKKR